MLMYCHGLYIIVQLSLIGLVAKLNNLWETVINKLDIDILRDTISLDITLQDGGEISDHSLIFEKVSSYFYVKGFGGRRFQFYPFEEGEYLELSALYYHDKPIEFVGVVSPTEEWANQCTATANFVLEIWGRILFIEAKEVTIDGTKYDV